MKAIPYLSFNGNCEEAVRFYHSVLGGELELLRFGEMPAEAGAPVGGAWKDKIMHASIRLPGGAWLFFSDSWEGAPVSMGSNLTVHLQVDSEEEVHAVFTGLSAGGEVTMPAGKVFWNSVYGSFVDRYGVSWGVEFELPA